MSIIKKLFCVFAICLPIPAWSVTLSGSANVNITSDTAVNAKNIAMAEARRQIIVDALSPYADSVQLRSVVANAEKSDLTNLISLTSIDGEKLSNTTYNAKINMTLDNNAIREWLAKNSIQNWLPDDVAGNRFVVVATLNEPMHDFAELNKIANADKIDVMTKSLVSNQLTLSVPVANKTMFTIAVRELGWKSSMDNNVLKIWK